MMSMNATTDTTPNHEPPAAAPGFERRTRDGRDEFVFRLDRSTPIVAAIAFAVGVIVGFALD